MRSTIPLRSRTQSQDQLRTLSPLPGTPPQLDSMATIRLISAAPSASGAAPGLGDPFIDTSVTSSPFVSVSPPTPLAPKENAQAPRKRLVPKKSKLGLLVNGKRSRTPERNDLSDVVHRVGGSAASVAKNPFEIYVDPTTPSDVGEVLMVKKKKSRAALSGLRWGTLAEVTNSGPPRDSSKVKLKNEDKEKWWSIGRGRKDSKNMRVVEKENSRANASGASVASRARFNSLDSSVILGATSKTAERPAQVRSASASESPLQDSGKSASYVSYPASEEAEEVHFGSPNTTTGSIAIRAMRSMRSVARLANWANGGKPMEKDTTEPSPPVKKLKHKQHLEAKKNKKIANRRFDSSRSQVASRLSGGSTEAAPADGNNIQASTTRKHSVLGLGFPTGFRFGTVRSSSAGSSSQQIAGSDNTLSPQSRVCSSSIVSAASSLPPTSATSRISSGSASAKWVGERLETFKVACRRERVSERCDERQRDLKEVRPRGAIVDVFADHPSRTLSLKSAPSVPTPALTVEETDGHSIPRSEPATTPYRQTRVRPASDQMIGKERFGSIRHEPDGVLSALDAATNELASLISRLDLEATPTTPYGTLRLSPSFTNLLAESPRLKSSPQKSSSSMTLPMHPNIPSLSSFNQESVPNAQRFGLQNCPRPVSPPEPPQVSPLCVPRAPSSTPESLVVAASSACESPVARPELSHVFRPLRPAKTKKSSRGDLVEPNPSPEERFPTQATATSTQTELPLIKSRSISKKKSSAILADGQKEFPLSKTFRKMMSSLSLSARKEAETNVCSDLTGLSMSKKAQKDLGLAGTLGGSLSSRHPALSMDLDNPYSDIPNELRVILTGGDVPCLGDLEHMSTSPPLSLTRQPPSPGLPPESPLPIPAIPQTSIVASGRPMTSVPWMDEAPSEDPDGSDISSLGDNDTKRSFDFTSELKRLSESAGTHRHSFVEQLESAFRTPAKYDLDGFGHFRPEEDVPSIPANPMLSDRYRLLNESSDPNTVTSTPVSPLHPSPEIVVNKRLTGAVPSHDMSQCQLQRPSALSKPSYGQLDLNFKFGSPALSAKSAEKSRLTLSDIIPSPALARSLSMTSVQDGFPLQSTTSHARSAVVSSGQSAHRRVDSDSSSKYSMNRDSRGDAGSLHSRASSQTSFKGLESFDEIRRGFEFVENRPAFYPPPSFIHRHDQLPRDSMLSIASVSSYGIVINPGVKDPFDYGYQSRPASCDMSAFVTMSTSVDDTFSFIRRAPRRKRVDSDSSSFYFRAPGTSRIPRPFKSQLCRDSVISTASLAPPVSIYNRSFGVHRRIDSVSSVSSAFAPVGFNSGKRSSWAPSHRRDMSGDSVMSDTSVRIPRPTLGDKMLDSRHDYCLPLTSITASPFESEPSVYSSKCISRRGSFDSILDHGHQLYATDSIMDQSSHRTSITLESAFGQDESPMIHSPLSQFRINDDRPFSLFSAEGDPTDPIHEDDTMISMIGGGRIRRRSLNSFVEGSPIFVRVGKRKLPVLRGQHRNIIQQPDEIVLSLHTDQAIEESPRGLGEERMISARQGLLSRNSLEELCLCADGVDTFIAEPVFSRPAPASRSRSGTHSSTSSGLDTPALSSSGETSSVASDSISSLDLSRVNFSLSKVSYPMAMQSRTRIRSKGHGHRRRLSGIQISRASVYETIEEENNMPVSNGFPDSVKAPLSPVFNNSAIIVDPDSASIVDWGERGIVALRRYYTLQDEVDVTIKESKQLWLDTPFSIYAVQSFEPPAHRSAMRALLEHSRQSYGPLSAEYCRIRSRTSSRPSPYPQPQRAIKISLSPVVMRQEVSTAPAPIPSITLAPAAPATVPSTALLPVFVPQALQPRAVNLNTVTTETLAPAKNDSGPLSRSRLGSNTRRSAFEFAKRGVGKENQDRNTSGGITTPSESLRLNRPRRPAHARAIVSIKA